jgi:hypothetical protein
MTHSNSIANRYGIKFKSGSTCIPNGLFDNAGDLAQMNMARDYLTEAVGDADEWFVYVLIAKTAGVKQASVRSPLKTFFNCITSHLLPFSHKKIYLLLRTQEIDSNY